MVRDVTGTGLDDFNGFDFAGPERESRQLHEQSGHLSVAHVGCEFGDSFLLASITQGIAHSVKRLIGRLGVHLFSSLKRSVKITIRDLALAKHQPHLIRISKGTDRFEGARQVAVVRLGQSNHLGSSCSQIRSGEPLNLILRTLNVPIFGANLRQLHDGPLHIVGPFVQTPRRCRVFVIPLDRLLLKDLVIGPGTGFSSQLPFRDRFSKQFLVGYFVPRASQPQHPRNTGPRA